MSTTGVSVTETVGTPRDRIEKLTRLRARDVEFAEWLKTRAEEPAKDVARCSANLCLRHYFDVGETALRYSLPGFCKRRFLCSLCDSIRASKTLVRYVDRIRSVLKGNGFLKCHLVTLTVKDGPNLLERTQHLLSAHREMMSWRRKFRSSSSRNGFRQCCHAWGGVYSVEVKRGTGSGQWHPHMHAVWLGDSKPDARELAKEWKNWTGDSHQVDVQTFRSMDGKPDYFLPSEEDLAKDLCEVVKYSLKFADMEFDDQFHAWQVLRRAVRMMRMVGSFGNLRGLKEADVEVDATRDKLDAEGRYVDTLWAWRGERKQYIQFGQTDSRHSVLTGEHVLCPSGAS